MRTVAARYSAGECGSVITCCRSAASRVFDRPVLTEGDEELLVAGEAILHGARFARQRGVVAIIGGGDSGDVGDIFRQRLLAVYG